MGQQVVGDHAAAASEGDPDADPDDERSAIELDRPAELRGDPLGHRDRLGLVADALDQERELVATLARGDVADPHDRPTRRCATSTSRRSPAPCPSESLTTLKSSMSRNRTATRVPASRGALERPVEVLAEEGPVREPRQRVVERVVEELRLEPLLLGRVDEQALRDAPAAGRLVVHRVRLVVDPDDRAVGGDHPVVDAEREAGRPVLGRARDGLRPIVGVGEARPELRVVDEGLRRVAEDGLDLRAQVGEVAAVGDRVVGDIDVDGRRDALDEGLVARIGLGALRQRDGELIAGEP